MVVHFRRNTQNNLWFAQRFCRKKIKLKQDCRKSAHLSMAILFSLTLLPKRLRKRTGLLSTMLKCLPCPVTGPETVKSEPHQSHKSLPDSAHQRYKTTGRFRVSRCAELGRFEIMPSSQLIGLWSLRETHRLHSSISEMLENDINKLVRQSAGIWQNHCNGVYLSRLY